MVRPLPNCESWSAPVSVSRLKGGVGRSWADLGALVLGALGAGILDHVLDHVLARGWAVRERKTRVIRFSPAGKQKMRT